MGHSEKVLFRLHFFIIIIKKYKAFSDSFCSVLFIIFHVMSFQITLGKKKRRKGIKNAVQNKKNVLKENLDFSSTL